MADNNIHCPSVSAFVLPVTNVPKAESRSSLPECGNKEGCDGIWCSDNRYAGQGTCQTWACDLLENCKKIVICKGLPEPYCMEGYALVKEKRMVLSMSNPDLGYVSVQFF
ncbi:unnamed protein product [Eruca vesicaria subsp. sativa]|uniref:Uncharacterized protein n=1 Tax=Eruca vesicaria subsp. sativa TaxID=29727 RepID=A0ABC8LBV1_ERUVS|nr:unnamed protein product [Eruca vesicaria subsp. sativa]